MSFEILGREIPLYGVFFWLGIFTAAFAAIFVCKRKGLPLFDLTCSAIYTMIGAIAGAKILYIIVSWSDIIEFMRINSLTFLEFLPMILKGGFVFYGGLIGGFGGLFIYAKQFKMDFILLLDIYAVVLPLGHALGRIGCFFGGCCYGIPYNGFLSHTYHTVNGAAPIGVPLFPVQLAEALCLFVLFFFQLFFLYREKLDRRAGFVYRYVFCYAAIRFCLEFLRGDAERGALLFLSTSQWISLGVVFITLVCLYFRIKNASLHLKEG